MTNKTKLIRTATIATSLDVLLKGQLCFLQKHFEVLAVSGNDQYLETVKNREGVEVIDIPMCRKISFINDLVSLFRLYKTFRKEKPLIVHSITPKAGLLSMLAAYMARVPIRMHSFTGLVFPTQKGLFQQLLINMDQLLCRFATHVYPEGQGVKIDMLIYNITKKPLKVLANGNINGIDTSYYNPDSISEVQKQTLRKQLGIASNDLVFCFVGRLVGDKGINELVKAFSEIEKLQASKNAKLLLLGSYEQELDPLAENTLQAIEASPNIIACGWQEDVRPFLAIGDVFVLPSYREGFPNVVLQAGSMGLPCIVTDINGSNEIIIDGVNGCIIPPKNAHALNQSMQLFLENPSLREMLAENARPLIASRYEQELVWDALLEEYKKLLREKNISTLV